MHRFITFIALAASVCGSEVDALETGTKSHGQTLIDRGLLTSLSDRGALRLDLTTGTLEIVYRRSSKGPVRVQLVPVEPAPALAAVDFLVLWSDASPDGVRAKAVCAAEAANVTTAANLVTNSCGNGNTLACSSARNAFDAAVAAFNACIAAVGAPPVE